MAQRHWPPGYQALKPTLSPALHSPLVPARLPEPTSSLPKALAERPVQLQGSALARAVLRALGWQLRFDGLPSLQGVLVVYPHTSNWDFPVAVLAKWALGLPLTFWGKDSLFRWPLLGAWMRWVGGLPVNRHAPQGAVGQMVQAIEEARSQGRFMWLALSPEGTRRRLEGWRTGFYRVALGAQVPVGVAYIDFGQRRVGVDSYWQLSGDMAADFSVFAQRLQPYRGKRPEWAAPVQPL
jgi:1-acyl-sn-glycerol-3-phosphate acyltransferase